MQIHEIKQKEPETLTILIHSLNGWFLLDEASVLRLITAKGGYIINPTNLQAAAT